MDAADRSDPHWASFSFLFFSVLIRPRESWQEMKKEIKEISSIDNDVNEKS